jgi:23S rRNA pseudouridine1911/1915/1917 synthase
MKRFLKEKYAKPGEVYLGLVHRLDRPVGGLVALARTGKAAARLSEQLRTHAMRRDYLAVVHGAEIPESGTLTDRLAKDAETGSAICVDPNAPDAREAVLHWQRLALDAAADTALLFIRLETGRKHQIRAQLAHAGHPVVQDLRYGVGEPGEPLALWGAALTLTHPTLKTPMTFLSRPRGRAFERFSQAVDAFLASQGSDP